MAIEGCAGSTKTTTVAAIREFAVDHAYSVYGFAPTTRAVKALSEAGLPARTVASLLENRLPEPLPSAIWEVKSKRGMLAALTNCPRPACVTAASSARLAKRTLAS